MRLGQKKAYNTSENRITVHYHMDTWVWLCLDALLYGIYKNITEFVRESGCDIPLRTFRRHVENAREAHMNQRIAELYWKGRGITTSL